MNRLRNNTDRAKVALVFVTLVLLVNVAMFISGYMQYQLLKDIAEGYNISDEAADANDIRHGAIAIIGVIIYLISVVTFIRWFRRAYYNLHLKIKNLDYSEGWAAGSWFVPFVNLYRPYKIMKELYEETEKLVVNSLADYNGQLSTSTVGLWWGMWIFSGIVDQIIYHYTKNAYLIDELIESTFLDMVSNVLWIPLSLVTIKVIHDYAKVEKELPYLNDLVSEFGSEHVENDLPKAAQPFH